MEQETYPIVLNIEPVNGNNVRFMEPDKPIILKLDERFIYRIMDHETKERDREYDEHGTPTGRVTWNDDILYQNHMILKSSVHGAIVSLYENDDPNSLEVKWTLTVLTTGVDLSVLFKSRKQAIACRNAICKWASS